MTFRHYVPHGTLLLALLPLISPLYAQPTPTPLYVALASDNTESNQHLQLGLRDFLMGSYQSAAAHFQQALRLHPQSALACCCLMLTHGQKPELLDQLSDIFAGDYQATPQEEALLATLLRLIQGDASGAGEEFAERATSYRNDTLSSCFAISLLHDGYDRMSDQWRPRPGQQLALKMAEELYSRKPDALVSYMRAWVESSNPHPSTEALSAAEKAVNALPEHPAPRLLRGHLLYLDGQIPEAIEQLHRASELTTLAQNNVPCGTNSTESDSPFSLLSIRAKLYESTLLWISAKRRESLKIQAELLNMADAGPAAKGDDPASILLHWEARTLPLRLMMLSPDLPSEKQVSAAVKAATPRRVYKWDVVPDVRDCLRFCLVARQRAAAGKGAEALRCIKAAEAALERLNVSRGTLEGKGGYELSAYTRMVEACQQAVHAAKAAAYPDTSDIWLQSLEMSQRPSSLLMPPVLPCVIQKTDNKI